MPREHDPPHHPARLGSSAGRFDPSVASATSPDAALLAFAATVEALALRSNEALIRVCDLDNERERLAPICMRAGGREAWEAKHEAAGRRLGLDAAEVTRAEAYQQLEAAVCEQTAMTPATFAGLAAKARVAVLLDPHDDNNLNDWEYDLRTAVLRDVATLGGGA